MWKLTAFFIFLLSCFLYFLGLPEWLVLAFIPLEILFLCVLSCGRQDKRYHGSKYTYSAPSHIYRTTNERAPLLSSHVFRPPVVTPQGTVPPPLIHTAPRAFPTPPSSPFRVSVDASLPRHAPPIYSPLPVVDKRHIFYAIPASGSLTTASGKQSIPVALNSTQSTLKIAAYTRRPEVDGVDLHASVTEEVDDRYPYDQQIKTDSAHDNATLSVSGVFKCHDCKRGRYQAAAREWSSNGICVQIWMSSSDHRYRTRLHSQKCLCCFRFVEPEVFKDDYVTKVVKVLDGWTGQRSVVKPLQRYPSTGPHKTSMCNACLKGVCNQRPIK